MRAATPRHISRPASTSGVLGPVPDIAASIGHGTPRDSGVDANTSDAAWNAISHAFFGRLRLTVLCTGLLPWTLRWVC
jgi:hypothetical protein